VRGVCNKTLGLLERIIKTADHMVQRDRQSLKLIAGAYDRQSLGEVVMRNELGFAGDALDRRQRALYQQIPAAHSYHDYDRQPKRREPQELAQEGVN
jgi:hypothetical protein